MYGCHPEVAYGALSSDDVALTEFPNAHAPDHRRATVPSPWLLVAISGSSQLRVYGKIGGDCRIGVEVFQDGNSYTHRRKDLDQAAAARRYSGVGRQSVGEPEHFVVP